MNWDKLIRIYTMIAGVSFVSLVVFGAQFSDMLLSILTVAVGTIAFVSVILGALLSATSYLGEPAADRPVVTRE